MAVTDIKVDTLVEAHKPLGYDACRVVIHIPIVHYTAEGLVADVVGFIEGKKGKTEIVLDYFSSIIAPPVFLTSYEAAQAGFKGSDVVLFVIDCPSSEHADIFVTDLWTHLSKAHSDSPYISELTLHSATFNIKRRNWHSDNR